LILDFARPATGQSIPPPGLPRWFNGFCTTLND
jgi:hypothetical protein